MTANALVTIRTLHDPVQAEMLRELLERAGIHAAVPGALHRGLLGPLGAYITIPLQVPARDASRARSILADLYPPEARWEVIDEHGRRAAARTVGQPHSGQDSDQDSDQDYVGPVPRIKRIAAFLSLGVTLGCGHFYARAMAAGGLLLAAELSVLALGYPDGTLWTFLAIPFLMGADLLGSARAIDRYNQGSPLSTAEQILRTAPLAAAAVFWAALTTGAGLPIGPAQPAATHSVPAR